MLKPYRFAIPVFLTTLSLAALDTGGLFDRDFILKKAAPLAGKTVQDAKIHVYLFCDPGARGTDLYLRILDDLSFQTAETKGDKVSFTAVGKGAENDLRLLSADLAPSILVRLDKSGEIFREYLAGELILPVAMIVRDGRVRWKGNPTELPHILRSMQQGTFSAAAQAKIEALRKDLQAAVQGALPDVIQRSADKILELAPSDAIAIQAKLYAYELARKPELAVPFLRDAVKKNPDEINLRLLLLEALSQTSPDAFSKEFELAAQAFREAPDAKLKLLIFGVTAAPFGWLPVHAARTLANESVASFEKDGGPRYAASLEFAARFAFLSGNPVKAVDLQKQANVLRRSGPAAADGALLLRYYESAVPQPSE